MIHFHAHVRVGRLKAGIKPGHRKTECGGLLIGLDTALRPVADQKEKEKMETQIKELVINGETYVRKGDVSQIAQSKDGKPYKIVRTYSAGVFAGYLESRNGREVVLLDARRIYQWTGAASLSQLAMSGTSNPKGCKFPEEVARVELLEAIEILDVTETAKKSIASVPVWTA